MTRVVNWPAARSTKDNAFDCSACVSLRGHFCANLSVFPNNYLILLWKIGWQAFFCAVCISSGISFSCFDWRRLYGGHSTCRTVEVLLVASVSDDHVYGRDGGYWRDYEEAWRLYKHEGKLEDFYIRNLLRFLTMWYFESLCSLIP